MNLKDINGVGEKVYKSLTSKGIKDVNSLLYLFPSSYNIYKLSEFSYFDEFNTKATIMSSVKSYRLKGGKTKLSFEALINDIPFKVSCFNMNYLEKTLKVSDKVVIVGKYENDYKEILLTKIFKEKDYKEGIYPDYNIESVNNPLLSRIIKTTLLNYQEKDLIIPKYIYQKYNYKTGLELLESIHFPKEVQDIENNKNALKYHELLLFSLKLELLRERQASLTKQIKNYNLELVKELINSIDFELTTSQKEVVNEIFKGLKSNNPLNMLLEGDTGSGKTICALISSYAVVTSSYQVALIAPTEVLAFQHFNTFKKYLNSRCNISLLTSSTKKKERDEIISKLKSHDIDIIIGTHSLLNDEIVFKNLGFVILDEQHKFGVEQRKTIRIKGNNPDILQMTATPIPRTLALTLYNDVDIVRIKEYPKNRKKVKTFSYTYKDYLKVLEFVRSEILDHKKAYFVASLIDDNIDSSYVSVNKVKEDLLKVYPNFKIGLLHGKLSDTEKLSIINDYKNNNLDILVSTTVIEVGIDDNNSSVIVVLDANRFGLSTLHQLRGRVGRGNFDSYAFFMVQNKDYLERLKILEETSDGFKVAEQDLIDRGPGELIGSDQSGLVKFKYANMFKDKKILESAIKDSKELIKDPKIRRYISDSLKTNNFD